MFFLFLLISGPHLLKYFVTRNSHSSLEIQQNLSHLKSLDCCRLSYYDYCERLSKSKINYNTFIQLTSINLENCAIRSMDWTECLINIESLNLNKNLIFKISGLGHSFKIHSLFLDENKIESVNEFRKLSKLPLRRLSAFEFEPSVLKKILPFLEEINGVSIGTDNLPPMKLYDHYKNLILACKYSLFGDGHHNVDRFGLVIFDPRTKKIISYRYYPERNTVENTVKQIFDDFEELHIYVTRLTNQNVEFILDHGNFSKVYCGCANSLLSEKLRIIGVEYILIPYIESRCSFLGS